MAQRNAPSYAVLGRLSNDALCRPYPVPAYSGFTLRDTARPTTYGRTVTSWCRCFSSRSICTILPARTAIFTSPKSNPSILDTTHLTAFSDRGFRVSFQVVDIAVSFCLSSNVPSRPRHVAARPVQWISQANRRAGAPTSRPIT